MPENNWSQLGSRINKMAFDTTILQERIKKVTEAFKSGEFSDVLVGAVNSGNGLMQQRIFTRNEDVEGNSFGQYIGKKSKVRLVKSKNALQNKRNKATAGQLLTPYQRKRALKGRQVLKKDLEFTGGLRRAIEIVTDENNVTLQFNNLESAAIASGQEAQITNIRLGKKGFTDGVGIPIFKFNSAEKEEVLVQVRELINQII